MRLFGIDITGCTFGLSSVNTSLENAEEHFIRPNISNNFAQHKKYKNLLQHKNAIFQESTESGCKKESAQVISMDYDNTPVSLHRINIITHTQYPYKILLNCICLILLLTGYRIYFFTRNPVHTSGN